MSWSYKQKIICKIIGKSTEKSVSSFGVFPVLLTIMTMYVL